MRGNWTTAVQAVVAALAVMLAVTPCRAGADEPDDPELQRLIAAANEVQASLSVTARTYLKDGAEVVKTVFHIDTGIRKYSLRYKTYTGEGAPDNPGKLNDWACGYGMIAPHSCWYHQGMLKDVALVGKDAGVYIMATEGKPRVLAAGGPRVGYDLVFTRPEGTVVVRTVALAGKEELFVSVSGKLAAGPAQTLRSDLYAFPQGFTAPFDRWVHGDGQDIRNAGEEKKQFPWDLDAGGAWMLLCDHAKPPAEPHMGPLGLVYHRAALTGATILHNRNYPIVATFTGPGDSEQRYILYTLPAMEWEAARQRLAAVADADELFRRAFEGLPPPLEE